MQSWLRRRGGREDRGDEKEGNVTMRSWTILQVFTLITAVIGGAAPAAAQTDDSGAGFVLRSTNFGNPCTTSPGDVPIVYDNGTDKPVDVSVKVVNTGQTNLFVGAHVIPPQGPQRRPRVMRITVGPLSSLGIKAQGSPCGWTAVIRPH